MPNTPKLVSECSGRQEDSKGSGNKEYSVGMVVDVEAADWLGTPQEAIGAVPGYAKH
ncbi:hypothetical protein DAPPUDRAFT_262772 [Daphnia pulex]|uniref:Uncharacterized protein n=1 Tax=Daphnia pulex TaxID=6669 RepID=E9HNN3_DAPPU|nr:hypothetical protein DAPPUDRAFT_262772 [Daphnia pulex]|eukprot:EFX66635.1 hypothetical protein DAPPUDRAFT_262772 [Daphnia pulex]